MPNDFTPLRDYGLKEVTLTDLLREGYCVLPLPEARFQADEEEEEVFDPGKGSGVPDGSARVRKMRDRLSVLRSAYKASSKEAKALRRALG
jgi:hypothetical protein